MSRYHTLLISPRSLPSCRYASTVDAELVSRLYRQAFHHAFGRAVTLTYCGTNWNDSDFAGFFRTLEYAYEKGIANHVKTLDLKDNTKVEHTADAVKTMKKQGIDFAGSLARALQNLIFEYSLIYVRVDRKWIEDSPELRRACRDRGLRLL